MSTLEEIIKTLERIRSIMPGLETAVARLTTTPTTPIATKSTMPTEPTELYDIGKIQSDLTKASASKKEAYDELIGLQSKTYESEYNKAGLGGLKTNIASIDTQIKDRKALRDQMLRDEEGKPIPQWMITGRKKLEIDRATDDINRLIDERNSLAEQYNLGINEVIRKVEQKTADAQTKYAFWENEEKRLSKLVETYQDILSKELARKEAAQKWEKEFALQLEEARKPKERALQSIQDEYGRVIGYFDPATGKTHYYPAGELGEIPTTKKPKEWALQPIQDEYGRIIGYFDPATGKTHYYTAEELGEVPTTRVTVFTEKDFRNKVKANIKAGLSLEDLKSDIATLGVVIKPPSTKTAEQIVEEEWAKAHPTTLWGKFIKWLPGGY